MAAGLCRSGYQYGSAQAISEAEATPSLLTEPGRILLVTEVSFKNTQADWLKLYYQSPSHTPANLKGLAFKDDSIFKKVDTDFWISSGTTVTLNFKNNQTDFPPVLNTTHTGLTGTTEQIIILDQNGKPLDAVCWTSSKPTSSEIIDLQELFDQKAWVDNNIQSCIPSDNIKAGQTIIRHNLDDTNSAGDWSIKQEETSEDTPATAQTGVQTMSGQSSQIITGPANTIPVIKTTNTTSSTAAIPKKSSGTTSKTSTKPKTTAAKTSAKKTTTSSKYKNGNLSESVIFSEIYPNPTKEDNQVEWVELFNSGGEDVNLGNWQLDDAEGGSKPFTLTDKTIIKAGSALLIDSKQSKLSLANTSDQVRLFNYQGDLISQIEYDESIKGQSYALINIENAKSEWLWTKDKTPGAPNPVYREISAAISEEPVFEAQSHFKIITTDNNTGIRAEATIYFDEDTIQAPLAKLTFTKGSEGKFLCSINPDKSLKLIKYQITTPAAAGQETTLEMPAIWIFAGCLLAAGIIIIMIKTRRGISPVQAK